MTKSQETRINRFQTIKGAPAHKNVVGWDIQTLRLARNEEGRPVYRLDANGILRYVYSNGELDEKSTADPNRPHVMDDGQNKVGEPTPEVGQVTLPENDFELRRREFIAGRIAVLGIATREESMYNMA